LYQINADFYQKHKILPTPNACVLNGSICFSRALCISEMVV